MMRRLLLLVLIVTIIPWTVPGTSFAEATGTANGTYDFGGTVGPVINDYQKVGDKFYVSTGFAQMGTSLTAASQTNPELNGFLYIYAESTTLNREFTFRDLGFSVTRNPGIWMSFIHVTLYNDLGQPLASYDNFNNANQRGRFIPTDTIQLSSWLNNGIPFYVEHVASIKILWVFGDNFLPSNFKLDNITIANVTGGFAVTYDGNGHTSGSVPSVGYVTTGRTGMAKGGGTLAKTGYLFAGWNTKADGTGTDYGSLSPLTGMMTNTTLYAKWVPISTYTVTYIGNTNTGGSPPIDGNLYPEGASVTVQGNGTLAKAGYTFAGWNSAADGSGTSYATGASLTMPASSLTLYAQWSVIPTYTVTYDGNGADSGGVPLDVGSYTAGASVTVQGNGTLAKAGYTFAGWNSAADGSGTSYAAGASLTMPASSLTLYAQWSVIPTYTVTYDGNGHTSGTPPVDSNAYPQSAIITVLGVATLEKAGYSFKGWNGAADGSGTNYAADDVLTIPGSNVTLYAQWTPIPPPPPPPPSSSVYVRTAKVIAGDGDDPSLQVTLFIGSSVESDGKRRDEVVLDPETARNIVGITKDYDKSKIRIVFDDSMSQLADEVTIKLPKATIQQLRQDISLEISTNAATLVFSKDSMAAPPDTDIHLKVIRQSGEQDALAIANPIAIAAAVIDAQILVTIPLKAEILPTDPTARKSFLSTLYVDIVRSDGTKQRQAGRIVYDHEGAPIAIQVDSRTDALRTYTIVSVQSYMKGYEDGTFRPDSPITRAELADILYRIGAEGVLKGDTEGDFQPNAPVSRAEMATIIVRWKQLTLGEKNTSFVDISGTAEEASIAAVAGKGYMIGWDGKFHPDKLLTRAEAATLFNRATGRAPSTGQKEQIWSDVPRRHWAFFEIAEATGMGADPGVDSE